MREIARLARILVDADGVSFSDAETRLTALTLEIVIGKDATTPASHAAALTAVVVGRRTFVGGVRVREAVDQRLNSVLPLKGTLGDALKELGAAEFDGAPSHRIYVGAGCWGDAVPSISAWWDGWRAGVRSPGTHSLGDGRNPLAGIAAGAAAVGSAFQAARGYRTGLSADLRLWGPDEELQSQTSPRSFSPHHSG